MKSHKKSAHNVLLKSLFALSLISSPHSVTADEASTTAKELKTLIGFDSSEEVALGAFNSTVNLEESSDSFGQGKLLSISFLPQERFSGVSFKPSEPWNLEPFTEFNLAVDLKNSGSESIQVYLSLVDERGQQRDIQAIGHRALSNNRSVNLAPNESGTYFFVVNGLYNEIDAGIREKPKPWNTKDEMFYWRYGADDLNLKQITQIGLFVRGNLASKSLLVDNIRLRKNPHYDTQFLKGLVDEFGQNAKSDFPSKVHSLNELKQAADRELAELADASLMQDRSRFGGWKTGPKLKATGFFRTQKTDGQWWMVDPEGYLFFTHGLANVRMANLTTLTGVEYEDESVRQFSNGEITPEDSLGIIDISNEAQETAFVNSELRRDMFTWLPEFDDELAEHYSYRRKVLRGPVKSGQTYSFYRANVERRYGQTSPESYLRKWEEVTLKRMQDWGFTSMGNWVDPAFYPNTQVPYFANGWIIGDFETLASKHDVWSSMPDPFDPTFVERADITIRVIAEEIAGSPWCVGIFVDNEKSWGFRQGTVEQRYGVILNALSKHATQSPAKEVFSVYLVNKYQDVTALNKSWTTSFADWDAVRAGFELDSEDANFLADLSVMLEMLSEEYFRVVHDTLAKHLPNHLYMGARMANFGMPDETIKASVKYSDVLSFNIYEEGMQEKEWSFLNEVDLPTVIGEFHIGATQGTGLFHPGLVQAHDQTDRAKMYTAYMESVAAHKNMVGAHWFQYVDSPITGRAIDGEPYNVGFVSNTDIPYSDMVNAAKRFNASLYPKRYALRKPMQPDPDK